jgi:hypothetical protein
LGTLLRWNIFLTSTTIRALYGQRPQDIVYFDLGVAEQQRMKARLGSGFG